MVRELGLERRETVRFLSTVVFGLSGCHLQYERIEVDGTNSVSVVVSTAE